MAPITAAYTFSTFSDDSSVVWVATKPNTQANLIKAVELVGCCRKVQGTKAVQWVAERTYYVRALLKEGGGGEYLRVGLKAGSKEFYPVPISMFRIPGQFAPPGLTRGTALYCGEAVCEYQYSGIRGTKVQDLTSSAKYPRHPTKMLGVTSGDFAMNMVNISLSHPSSLSHCRLSPG